MLTVPLSSQASLAQSAMPAQSTPPVDSPAMPSRMPEGHAVEASLAENAEVQTAKVPPAQQLQAAPAALPAQHASTAREVPQQAQTLLGEVNDAVGAIATPTPAGTPHSWEDTGARQLLESLIDVCDGGTTQ